MEIYKGWGGGQRWAGGGGGGGKWAREGGQLVIVVVSRIGKLRRALPMRMENQHWMLVVS